MDPTKEKYKRVRGLILKMLAYEHPRVLDDMVLYALLDDMGYPISQEEFHSHLAYLGDETKGYLEVEEKKARSVEIVFVKITPKGLDLLDRFTPECDPGVNINF